MKIIYSLYNIDSFTSSGHAIYNISRYFDDIWKYLIDISNDKKEIT